MVQHVSKRNLLHAIIFALFIGYGILSPFYNQNPYYRIGGGIKNSNSEIPRAKAWTPSPFWLPSYFLCYSPWPSFTMPNSRYGFRYEHQSSFVMHCIGCALLSAFTAFIFVQLLPHTRLSFTHHFYYLLSVGLLVLHLACVLSTDLGGGDWKGYVPRWFPRASSVVNMLLPISVCSAVFGFLQSRLTKRSTELARIP